MKVLLIGSGGREHALFAKISESPKLTSLHVFPGNGGFPQESILKSPLYLGDLNSVRKHIQEAKYDLIVVGPEQPLVDGIADALADICPVFGPSKAAARLEGSKEFSKGFMQKYNIPTAQARVFTDFDQAWAYVQRLELPLVIKADGLAAGKGVCVCPDHVCAKKALQLAMKEEVFGKAGKKVLIEEFLEGDEISVFALCDGHRALPFLPAQDHKRAYDNDKGPNTGGMGAYLPVPLVNDQLMAQIQTEILDQVIIGMQTEGLAYKGLLYAGLMVHDGRAKVVEFNVRFGDPETQAILPLLNEDLLALLYDAATGNLHPQALRFHKEAAIVIVLAAEGYPADSYKKDIPLKNLDLGKGDIMLRHAQTRWHANRLVSSGGRVLNVVARGPRVKEAAAKAYHFLEKNPIDNLFYRKDIGLKAHL